MKFHYQYIIIGKYKFLIVLFFNEFSSIVVNVCRENFFFEIQNPLNYFLTKSYMICTTIINTMGARLSPCFTSVLLSIFPLHLRIYIFLYY